MLRRYVRVLTAGLTVSLIRCLQDIVPEYGFTLHKPSVLWPPPSNEIIDQMRNTLRHSARQIVHLGTDGDRVGNHPTLMDAIDTDTISLRTEAGKLLEIDQQMQVYTRNSLLAHPLVSPTFSYLGGLPPLFFIASDKEVLRDEVIYWCVIFTVSLLHSN